MIEYFKKGGIGFILSVVAIIFAIIALITYCLTGITDFTPKLSIEPIIGYILFIVISIIAFLFSYKIIRLGAFAIGLYAFLQYIVAQLNYIANLFSSIDPTAITFGFVFVIITSIIVCVSSLISAILCKDNCIFYKNNQEVKS